MKRAVALRYDTNAPAPYIVAKERGALADRMIEIARDYGIETVTVKFAVAAGKWQTQATFDGKSSHGVSQEKYGFQFAKPYVEKNRTYVTVTDNMLEFPCRLVAVDKDGAGHKPAGSNGGTTKFRQITFKFELSGFSPQLLFMILSFCKPI